MNSITTQRVVVIDDHPLIRKGLQQLSDLCPEVEIIGEADNGEDGLNLVSALKPDLVLLDLNMPGMNGIDTLVALKKLEPDARVIILTVSNAEEDVVSALRNRAVGYLLKDMDQEELLTNFREVAEGRVVMSPSITQCLARALQAERTAGRRDETHRTRAESSAASAGRRKQQGDCASTQNHRGHVKVHVKHLLKKLGLKTRVEAAVWAVNNNNVL